MRLNEIQLSRILDQARSLREEDKYLHAAQLYRRLILAEPTFILPYVELSSLYAETGQLPAVIHLLLEGHTRNPDNDEIVFLLGSYYLRLQQYDTSLSYFERLIERKLPHVHFNMGIAYFYKNDIELAEEQFRLTMKYDPKFPKINESLGELLIERQAYAEAIEYLNRGVAADPYSAVNHHLLGVAHSRIGNWKHAYNEFVLAIDMDPNEPPNWQMCGEALLHLNRLDEAEPYLRKALELSPQSIDALVALSHLLTVRGDTKRAREYVKKAVLIDPEYARAREARWWKFRHAQQLRTTP
jgi:tetratricopeptide (TPR) repeat protein